MRHFLWGGGEFKPGSHLVNWTTASLSISLGGLEIGSLEQWNVALLTKWGWRFSEDFALWRMVVASIYGIELGGKASMLKGRRRIGRGLTL